MAGWTRWKFALAGGVLAATVGCRSTPTAPSLPAPPPAPSPSLSKTIVVPEPADDPSSAKSGPLAPSTLIVFADTALDAIQQDPNKPTPERERLLTKARQLYAEALAADPKNAEALLGLSRMYQLTGEREQLAATEKRLKEMHAKNPKVWAAIAVRQGQAKDWDAAAESYFTATKLDPDNRQYRIHLGFTLARAGRYEEGYAWLNKSMRETDARYNLSLMMAHNGHTEKARQQLQSTLQADPNFKPAVNLLSSLTEQQTTPAVPAAPVIRTVGYEEAPEPTRVPLTPRPMPVIPPQVAMPSDPAPLGVSGPLPRNPLPPAYTATSGWDTTLPPQR
jgi:Tfp pilus assembly protein PilF